MYSTQKIVNMLINELIENDLPAPSPLTMCHLAYNADIYYRRLDSKHTPLLSERFFADPEGPLLASITDFYGENSVVAEGIPDVTGECLGERNLDVRNMRVALLDSVGDAVHEGYDGVTARAMSAVSAWAVAHHESSHYITDKLMNSESTYNISPVFRVVV